MAQCLWTGENCTDLTKCFSSLLNYVGFFSGFADTEWLFSAPDSALSLALLSPELEDELPEGCDFLA